MIRRRMVCALAALAILTALALFPSPSPAASKEIQELQRDMALLQEQMKTLLQSQDRHFAEIRTLVQQSIVTAGDASKAVAVIQSGMQQNLRDQETKVVTPVVGLSARMDQMSNEVRSLQQAVGDLTSLLSRMQTQLTDLSNAVKVMAAPPAPPPPTDPSSGSGTGPGAAAAPVDTPSISATDLYNAALRDQQGGKLDLAAQGFSDYLRWYGNTDLAPNAQYYIASIHQRQQKYGDAVREYDMVLEKYPDNNKTPDALYGKGSVLVKMGKRTDGAREFQELLKRFPSHTLASQACTQLTTLGFRCPTATGASATKRKK